MNLFKDRVVVEGLQCGHGGEAVESLQTVCRRGQGDGISHFNAATAVKPWRALGESVVGGLFGVHFNAATAVKPWRAPAVSAVSKSEVLTSMRPRR